MESRSESDESLTRLLERWVCGDAAAAGPAMNQVYDCLRRIAARALRGERPEHTLSSTALVHEAFLRLNGRREPWPDRAAFLRDCGHQMRKILVDHARRRRAAKRSADPALLPPSEGTGLSAESILAIDEAIEELAKMEPRAVVVVEQKLFVGLREQEIAELLGASRATVQRDWKTAQRWLGRRLQGFAP